MIVENIKIINFEDFKKFVSDSIIENHEKLLTLSKDREDEKISEEDYLNERAYLNGEAEAYRKILNEI